MSNSNKKILIVEDEDSLLRVMVNKFKNEKFEVFEAKNGKEGIKKALENHPDLILLDIVMPVMDGMSMLKELRKDEWGQNVPVILLTNLSDAQKAIEALESGVHDHLVKSNWKLEEVVEKVKERLGV